MKKFFFLLVIVAFYMGYSRWHKPQPTSSTSETPDASDIVIPVGSENQGIRVEAVPIDPDADAIPMTAKMQAIVNPLKKAISSTSPTGSENWYFGATKKSPDHIATMVLPFYDWEHHDPYEIWQNRLATLVDDEALALSKDALRKAKETCLANGYGTSKNPHVEVAGKRFRVWATVQKGIVSVTLFLNQ